MTVNILSYSRDGARVIAVQGKTCTVQCACGRTYTKRRDLLIRKHVKMRCAACFREQMRQKAIAETNRFEC